MASFFESIALDYEGTRIGSGELATSALDEAALAGRLGPVNARRRLLTEREYDAFDGSESIFQIVRRTSSEYLIRAALLATGLYQRGMRNAARVELKRNRLTSPRLPKSFDGFTILHLSDLHVDMNRTAMLQVEALVRSLEYDVCVFTGDFRGKISGPFGDTLAQLARITKALEGPLYGVLGNHDSIAMVPGLEKMGVRMLLNERVVIERGGDRLHLAGIDDAHAYGSGSVERAAAGMPHEEFSVLISHTPEVYCEAERSGFDLMLSGHTHGGQICLPGGIPITLDAQLPRYMGRGAWRYGKLRGYTSVGAGSSIVPVRFNCPPEITLHHFAASA
jgi:predicted MPP superfamily phosphohydrolase